MLNETKVNLSTEANTCATVGYQRAKLCVPVTIAPFATPGTTVTTCCGDPSVQAGNTCEGTVNGSCSFTITQDICVAVPVDLGAVPFVGSVAVSCGTPSNKDICSNCKADSTNQVSATAQPCTCNPAVTLPQ